MIETNLHRSRPETMPVRRKPAAKSRAKPRAKPRRKAPRRRPVLGAHTYPAHGRTISTAYTPYSWVASSAEPAGPVVVVAPSARPSARPSAFRRMVAGASASLRRLTMRR